MPRTGVADTRKRKIGEGEFSSCSSSLASLKRRSGITDSENSDDQRATPSSDRALSSCTSSNASSKVIANQKHATVDPQVEDGEAISVQWYNLKQNERRRQSPGELEAESVTAICSPDDNSRHQRTTAVKMQSDDAELEEFFSTAEKDLHKQFTQKYNFDIEKEEAVEGRFTWICVKP